MLLLGTDQRVNMALNLDGVAFPDVAIVRT